MKRQMNSTNEKIDNHDNREWVSCNSLQNGKRPNKKQKYYLSQG